MANGQFAEAIERATLTGKSLDEIDAEIIEPAPLSQPQKGALLLFAYSLRRRGEQRRYARESLALTGLSLPRNSRTTADRFRKASRSGPLLVVIENR
jgi:hypothetical protein